MFVQKGINLLTMQVRSHMPGFILTTRTNEVFTVVLSMWQITITTFFLRLRQLETAVVIPLTTVITSYHGKLFIIWLLADTIASYLCSQNLPSTKKTMGHDSTAGQNLHMYRKSLRNGLSEFSLLNHKKAHCMMAQIHTQCQPPPKIVQNKN
jgi:hypothetical protein